MPFNLKNENSYCWRRKRLVEFRKIIANEHELIESENFKAQFNFSAFDIIVDLNADDRLEIADSVFTSGKFVLLCAVKKSLAQMTNRKNISSIIAGINSLPTFLSRPVQEISFLNQHEFSLWKNIFESLNWKTKL